MRAFLAIAFPSSIKEAYGTVLESFRQRYARLRWVKPECVHLTLRFLGEISPSEAEALEPLVTAVAATRKPFRMSLGDGGTFGPRSAPRVFWLGVADGLQPLEHLQLRVEDAVYSLGFPPPAKAWRAHVTLARPASGRRDGSDKGKSALTAGLWREAADSGLTGLWFDVTELVLFESRLAPEGPTYRRVWRAPLGEAS